MEHTIPKVGIREFRNNIAKYISAETVAVTNHGRTVGYYIPVNTDPVAEDFIALKDAARKMAALLSESNLTEDQIVEEFRAVREGNRAE
jgi:antitoxin (DNA-binding transcriptional repressor) of toxin-antitoxin stability system